MRGPIGFTCSFHEAEQDRALWTADMDRLQGLGATAIRVGFSPWLVSSIHLDHIEWCLQDATARGLKVLIITAQLPNMLESDVPLATKYDQAVEYIEMLAPRFAQYATWWQVLNEHDARAWDTYEYLGTAWDPATGDSRRAGMTDAYLETVEVVMSRCRAAIHAVRPDIPVGTALTGESISTANEEYQWRPFHRIVTSVDFIGINGYPFDTPINYIEMPARLRRTAHWAGKPVILTEIGLPTQPYPDAQETMEWVARQVDYGTRSADVEALFVYCLRDTGTDATDPEQSFGVFEHDGTPKAGWRAVRTIIRSITDSIT